MDLSTERMDFLKVRFALIEAGIVLFHYQTVNLLENL